MLEDRKTGLEADAGMTYQEALALYQEKLPANTVALNRLNETLTTIGTNRTGALGTLQSGTTSSIAGIHAAEATDRVDTTDGTAGTGNVLRCRYPNGNETTMCRK